MTGCAAVRKALKEFGVLLLQDQELPSVVGIFCGRRVNKSWWGIPEAHEIYRCLESLDSAAAATRLIKGKVTFVHRRLWPALVTVGAAKEPWQMRALSGDAKRLLVQTDRGESPLAHGATARDLQERLLVVAHEVHTPTGRHDIQLEQWRAWAGRMKVQPLLSPEEARAAFEAAVERLGASRSALPWA